MNSKMKLVSLLFDFVVFLFKKPAPTIVAPPKVIISLDGFIEGTQFTWGEALRQGNTAQVAVPTPEQEDNIKRQALLLEKVVENIGPIRITSWLRTPEHNKAVKGAPHSSHLVGAATDFIPLKMSVEAAKKILKNPEVYPGGGELNTTTWVHLDHIHTRWFLA